MASQYDLPYTGPQVEALLAKISELESEMPSKTSDLTNDSGFITSSDVPTKTSDLNNDSGFITNAPVAAEAARAQAAEALLATIASLQAEITRATGVEGTLQDLIDGIAAKIPSAATDQNQLADKAFVNSSIATATAEFRGTYNSLAELQAVSADENDYGYVRTTDAAGNTVFKRYKYAAGSWVWEYDLNNSSFTASQWAAINSAITAELVAKLSALPTNAALTELLNGKQGVIADLDTIRANAAKGGTAYQKPAGGIPKTDLESGVQTSLGKADSAVQDVSGKADKTELEALAEEVAKKANTDGYYGGMTVGSAENLVGRGSVEAEYAGIRTSAGSADIGSGSASITRMKGNSFKWNQNVKFLSLDNWMVETGVTASFSDGIATVDFPGNNKGLAGRNPHLFSIISGHKYYVSINAYLSSAGTFYFSFGVSTGVVLTKEFTESGRQRLTGICTATASSSNAGYIYTQTAISGCTVDSPMLIDLTLLGIDNLATVGEVEDWLEENGLTLDYYDYNPGEVINNRAATIETIGFNRYNPETGKAFLPGKYSDYPQEYEICGTFTSISFRDINGNESVPTLTDGRFFNVDAPGELTVVGGNATDTLVHLVWSGWRNQGKPDYAYEAYWNNTLNLNLTQLTGKLNGAGESVVIFPNGPAKIGEIQDEIVGNKAIKRIGVVDMGTLEWGYTGSGSEQFYATIFDMVKMTKNSDIPDIITTDFETVPFSTLQETDNKRVISARSSSSAYTGVTVREPSYTDAATFKSAMSGVLLYYELATPEEYILDTTPEWNYRVDDFGTERVIPSYSPSELSAPIAYDVQYAMNAVDAIRRLDTNYVRRDNVKQTAGRSETDVLSQKGVDDNYAKKVGTEDNLVAGAAKNIAGTATSGGYPFTFVRISGTDGLAKINSVNGNSVVWNQLVDTITTEVTLISGRKYYKRIGGTAEIVNGSGQVVSGLGSTDNIIDLTLMFGAGNEPATVEEFEAMFPLPYYDYNPGEIISNKTEQVNVVGFNQWDEEWEAGSFDTTTGEKVSGNATIRTKNPIRVIGNSDYYLFMGKNAALRVLWYDGQMNLISTEALLRNVVRTSPSNAVYLHILCNGNYGTTYLGDICINISDPSRNGTYEPYKTNTIELNLPTLTGKLNGEGESVVVFPDGLRGTGSAYDSLNADQNGLINSASDRFIEVKIKDLTWSRRSRTADGSDDVKVFAAATPLIKINTHNYLISVPDYKPYYSYIWRINDRDIYVGSTNFQAAGQIILRDDRYANVASFVEAMGETIILAERKTPLTYTLDDAIQENFQSYKGGTLLKIPENGSVPTTAPHAMSLTYSIDIGSILTNMPQDYSSKETLTAMLAAMQSAGIIGSYSMTYNATAGRYDFTFTKPTTE